MAQTIVRSVVAIILSLLVPESLTAHSFAQVPNGNQQLLFAGLRSVNQQGQINGIATDRAGNLYLLLNEGDGVRLLVTDANANAILAQSSLGTKGDVGVALALDPAGNVLVTGTTTSTALAATAGAAIPARTDASTNSFVAKFDSSLNPLWVTFTGGSRISATAIAATADAVFVTGITYASNLPVTSNGIQQSPAYASLESGFVERFSSDGSALVYATYLTGANGDTTPATIAADPTDAVYIAGSTSASGFPTIAALIPEIISNPSGFLTKLSPAGDSIDFSSFVPGSGLTSIAIDSSGQTLLISGSVALGQFPVDTVSAPLIPVNYQVLLRMPLDGSAVLTSTLIAPGSESFVAAGPKRLVWVDGTMTAPMLPIAPLGTIGDGFAVRVLADGSVDQTARFGGLPNRFPAYASLPTILDSIAVDANGAVILGGAVQPTASSTLLATETYDLPILRRTPAFPSTIHGAVDSTGSCLGSLCAGSAAYLAKLDASQSGSALTFSTDDLPLVVLRNLGSAEIDVLQLTATGATLATNCGSTLFAGGECDLLLTGSGPGILTASSSGGAVATMPFPAFQAVTSSDSLAVSPKELDFGIQSSVDAASTRTITVTNFGNIDQTFTSAIDSSTNPKGTSSSPFTESSSDCPTAGSVSSKLLVPGSSCHIVIAFVASTNPASDGTALANWSIGSRDVRLTGYAQSAALSVSATEVDFGLQFSNGLKLPRYVYLSNSSIRPTSHAPIATPSGSAFLISDSCPKVLPGQSVCRIRIDYRAASIPSSDSFPLALDQGLVVLLTGKTIAPQSAGGSSANPNLTVSPSSITFTNAVLVTATSSPGQTISVGNTGTTALQVKITATGDFLVTSNCGSALGAGQSCSIVPVFAPLQPGLRQGLVAITTGSGTAPFYVSLSGTSLPILPANNGSLDSGDAPIGQPVVAFYKVTQPISQLKGSSSGPFKLILVEDVGTGPGSPPALSFASSVTGACYNCWLGIQFQPSTAGNQSGSLTLTSSQSGAPYVIALTGNGLPTGGLILSPMIQDFGTIPVNSTSGTYLFTLTNVASSSTTIDVGSPSTSGDFSILNTTGGSPSCRGPLTFGASCQVAVAFSPTGPTPRSGLLSFSGTTASASLTGSGISDPGFAINPLALVFSNVPGVTATAQTAVLKNTSTLPLQITGMATGTASFQSSSQCAILAPGATCAVTVTYLPGSAIAADTLNIFVDHVAGPPQTATYSIALSGTYTNTTAGLQIVPSVIVFGPVADSKLSSIRQVTLNNLTSKSLAVKVAIPREFSLQSAPCVALAPNSSCSISVAFAPLTNGTAAGTLYAQGLPSDGSAAVYGIGYAEGFGTGLGNLSVTGGLLVNGNFDFGQVTVGQTASQSFTVANLNPAGSPSITVRRITSGPPFLSQTDCGSTLLPGQSCVVSVSYSPTSMVGTGSASTVSTLDSGTLIIESDAASGPDVIGLRAQSVAGSSSSQTSAPQLATFALSQSSLTFPQSSVGNASAAQTITLKNSGSATLHVASIFSAVDFTTQTTCGTVIPGDSCSISVAALPQSAGFHSDSLEILSDSANSLEFVSLLTDAAPSLLGISPSQLDFGSALVGSTTYKVVTVTNNGASPIQFSSITAGGDYAVTNNCLAGNASLVPGSSCTAQVAFAPTITGNRSGLVSIVSSASTNALTVALTGTGTRSELVVTPSAIGFGDVVVGTTVSLPFSLQNTGTTTITNVSIATSGDYAVLATCQQTSLPPGATCTAQLAFTPSVAGSRSASLSIASSDPGSPIAIPLSGKGVLAPGLSITVNGGTSASVTVASGNPASFGLSVSPTNGFAGSVALTCRAIAPAQFASCSIQQSSLDLANGAQTAVVTITTLIGAGGNAQLRPASNAIQSTFLCLLFPGLLTVWKGRRELAKRRLLLVALLLAGSSMFALGCSSGGQFNLLYTPPGSYQYMVTATSTGGPAAPQSVLLNLIVTSH